MHRVRRGSQAGFTLVEVLIACLLLAGGVAATASVFSSIFGTQASAERIDAGVATGVRELENLRALPFAELAVAHNAAMPGGGPAARVTGSGSALRLTRPGAATEDLVDFRAASPYSDYEVRTVGTHRFGIYRFVSWRDEECPVVDLSSLDTALGDLRGLLTTTTGTLTTLVGPSGTLTSALTDSNSLLGGGLLGALLAPLLSAVNQVVAVLNPINALLTSPALLSPLQGLLTQLNSLLDPVTGRLSQTLDLCDIPAGVVPSLADVQAVTAVLGALNPVLSAIAPLTQDVGQLLHSLVNLDLFGLLGAVVKAPLIVADAVLLVVQQNVLSSVLGGVVNALGSPATLPSLATGLTTSLTKLAGFLLAPDTTHNTKRVTVAVVLLNPPSGRRAPDPAWVSTVVTDPADGLL